MTSTIILRTDSKLKQKAQQTAEALGLTLTSVVNNYLSDFVEKKSVSFSKQKFTNPLGMFSGPDISEKSINKITKSWMKTIGEIG